jgi:hypothetical protein
MVCIGLIIAGILGLKFVSREPVEAAPPAARAER